MKILSVDWDFFFPNQDWYDWGHREAPFFKDEIWMHRCAAFNLKTKEEALAVFHPDMNLVTSFWKKVVKGLPSQRIIICDSHVGMYQILETIGYLEEVDNYDAHHDLGYENLDDLACDNWAYFGIDNGLIGSYNLYYPMWRGEEPEGDPKIDKNCFTFHGFPKEPKKYDYIFICRSSAWTPPWSDGKWIKFIHHWKKYEIVWFLKLVEDWVMVKRSLNIIKAKEMAKRMRKAWKEVEKLNQ